MQLKELKWLRYLAYLGMIAAAGIIYIFAPAFGKKMIDGDTVFMPYYWPWLVAIFVIGAVGLFGIFLLTRCSSPSKTATSSPTKTRSCSAKWISRS